MVIYSGNAESFPFEQSPSGQNSCNSAAEYQDASVPTDDDHHTFGQNVAMTIAWNNDIVFGQTQNQLNHCIALI